MVWACVLAVILVLLFIFDWPGPVLAERVAGHERLLRILGQNKPKEGLTLEEIQKSVKTPINKKDLPVRFARMVGGIIGKTQKKKSPSRR